MRCDDGLRFLNLNEKWGLYLQRERILNCCSHEYFYCVGFYTHILLLKKKKKDLKQNISFDFWSLSPTVECSWRDNIKKGQKENLLLSQQQERRYLITEAERLGERVGWVQNHSHFPGRGLRVLRSPAPRGGRHGGVLALSPLRHWPGAAVGSGSGLSPYPSPRSNEGRDLKMKVGKREPLGKRLRGAPCRSVDRAGKGHQLKRAGCER